MQCVFYVCAHKNSAQQPQGQFGTAVYVVREAERGVCELKYSTIIIKAKAPVKVGVRACV